jgi:hypothetical protein
MVFEAKDSRSRGVVINRRPLDDNRYYDNHPSQT